MFNLKFPHEDIPGAMIPEDRILTIIKPNDVRMDSRSIDILIKEALKNPVGTPRLSEMLGGEEKVLILVDDYTRMTPAEQILPILIQEIESAGVKKEQIELLVASGTHRAMTDGEKISKYGEWVTSNFKVNDHLWYDNEHLIEIGKTENGTEIVINRMLVEADFVIGVGHIVPHRVAGYSGGAKIVQPGVCGAVTTGQTHWLSARDFSGIDIMGKIDNPVRREIDRVGVEAGLKFIFNTVQAGNGNVYLCVCGDPVKAHKAGCRASEDVYGCEIKELADIVISDAYPSHMNMWQSSKGVYSADLALKEDGILILVTPSREGIAEEHPEVGELGYSNPEKVMRMVEDGSFSDLTVAAHILHVGRVISGNRTAFMVSTGIGKEAANRLGFEKFGTVQDAIEKAMSIKGPGASITVINHAGEVMPVLKG